MLVGALSALFFWLGLSGTEGEMVCAVLGGICPNEGFIAIQGWKWVRFFLAGPARVCCAVASCVAWQGMVLLSGSCPTKG